MSNDFSVVAVKIGIVIKIRLTLLRWKGTWDRSLSISGALIFRAFHFLACLLFQIGYYVFNQMMSYISVLFV